MSTDEQVLRRFLDDNGRLAIMPTKRSKRLLVLDHICQEFEPGVTYPEVEVNRVLRGYHDDVAALRRYLVDEQFLSRESNIYRRTGGTPRSTTTSAPRCSTYHAMAARASRTVRYGVSSPIARHR